MGIAREVINMVRSKYIDGKKVCSICKEAYPMTEEYFCSSNRIKDGFRGQCKKCKHKVDYEDVKAHVQKKNKERYEKNKDEILKKQRIYSALKKEHYKKYHAEYYKEHRCELKQRSIDYYHENKSKLYSNRKEYVKRWWNTEKGKEKRRIYCQKRRSLKDSLPNSLTVDEWNESIEYFNNECAYCGCDTEMLHQDHVIPISKGGGYIKSNIIPACPSCNFSKNRADMETWYKKQTFFLQSRLDMIHLWVGADLKNKNQQLSIL